MHEIIWMHNTHLRCFNFDSTFGFLQKLGKKADDQLLSIISKDGLQSILCCGANPLLCAEVLAGLKCFLHSPPNPGKCEGLKYDLL